MQRKILAIPVVNGNGVVFLTLARMALTSFPRKIETNKSSFIHSEWKKLLIRTML